MPGIVSYGAYIPYWRLSRGAIAATLGSGGGKGSRSVASYDEDSTSLGVEAARITLRSAPADTVVHDLIFCATAVRLPRQDNATAIHAALALPAWSGAYDAAGAVRSAWRRRAGLAGAGRPGRAEPTCAPASPGGRRTRRPAATRAAALLFGDGPGRSSPRPSEAVRRRAPSSWTAGARPATPHSKPVGGALQRGRLRAGGRRGRRLSR